MNRQLSEKQKRIQYERKKRQDQNLCTTSSINPSSHVFYHHFTDLAPWDEIKENILFVIKSARYFHFLEF